MPFKTIHRLHARILALDLHPRRFGYVVIAGSGTLLDWGVRRSHVETKSHPEVLAERLRFLLKTWMPDAVVTRIGERRRKDVGALFRAIKKATGGTLLLPILRSRDDYLGRSKYERAVEIAARFPEIAWKPPSKRKPWESEHYSISIFEALAVALMYSKDKVTLSGTRK
jgi:hypothetical protein